MKDLKQDMRNFKDKLKQGHRVRKRMNQMQEAARKLVRAAGSQPASFPGSDAELLP